MSLLGKGKIRRAYLRHIQGDPCSYCGRKPTNKKRSTLDHIVPRVMGGGDSIENLTAACRPCNNGRKKDKSLLFFLLECKDAL